MLEARSYSYSGSDERLTAPFHESIPAAPARFISWLSRERNALIKEWVQLVVDQSVYYRQRPASELNWTISHSFSANMEAMSSGRVDSLEEFVRFITKLRLEAGFPLPEVHKGFDAYRLILTPKVLARPHNDIALPILESVNACVSYQIQRFTQQFQKMHERAIRAYAENLEVQIEQRTRELAASQQQYKMLVEEMNDGFFVVKEENIIFANKAFCAMHGLTPDETIGRPFWKLVSSKDRGGVRRLLAQVRKVRPETRAIDFARTGPSGKQGLTEMKAKAVDLGDGLVVIGICRDITDRVEMERQVRENERMAYVGSLTASLSHEIRNPLSAIKMNMQILGDKVLWKGYDRRRLEIMVDEVTRLEGILRRLLDTAKPLALSPTLEDVNELIKCSIYLLEPKFYELGLKIRRRFDSLLPRVMIDRAVIEQAVINLLLNAVEAVPAGGCITIGTSFRDNNGSREFDLFVRDNGRGLSREEMDKVFTPFFTVKPQGVGLGLTNVKRIVEAHNGRITVQSRSGRGAKFILTLPAEQP